jgi:hypothetical protein
MKSILLSGAVVLGLMAGTGALNNAAAQNPTTSSRVRPDTTCMDNARPVGDSLGKMRPSDDTAGVNKPGAGRNNCLHTQANPCRAYGADSSRMSSNSNTARRPDSMSTKMGQMPCPDGMGAGAVGDSGKWKQSPTDSSTMPRKP